MPLYEYECEADGRRFEVIQKFSDPPITTCPSCGGTVRKLLSSPAIQFKGSGWYITDYARKGGGESGKDSKSDASATPPSGTSAKSEPSSSSSAAESTPAKAKDKD